MRERSVVFNSVSKTYSATGWRVGYAAACPQLSDEIRKVHDLLSAGTNSLAQQAAVAAYKRPGSYYQKLLKDFIERKAVLEESLARLELDYFSPEGGYYLWADIRSLGYIDDLSFCQDLIQHAGVAVVPGRCFTQGPSPYVRFCFAKKVETLQEASQRLKKLTPKRS